MTQLSRVLISFTFLLPLCIQIGNSEDIDKLPVKRVVLYKNGVGYFEHVGRVRDNHDVTISFTSSQLNDVLKSLTVLDLNGGRITGVAYGSAPPLDRQLGDLRLPVGDKASMLDILGALRGARMEIRSGTLAATGRLLSTERKYRVLNGTTMQVDFVSLITDPGEVRTIELSPSFSVRLLEAGLTGKMDRFLDLISSAREPDSRSMVISTSGSGERSMFVSYISEVPVWKTTYRIVLDPKASSALLQGWAIVDNTVGEDWNNVDLSLVAGAPQSFIQNLSQPYYTRRPVVPLPESVNISPQTFEATLLAGGPRLSGSVRDPSGAAVPNAAVKVFDSNGALAGETRTDAEGNYAIDSLRDGVMRVEVQAPGFNRTVVNGVESSQANSIRQDVTLQAGMVAETVTVNAPVNQAALADTASVSTRLGTGRTLGSGVGIGGGHGAGYGSGAGGGFGGGAYRVGVLPAAQARELGDLFEYKLKQPITIQKNRSALVPILQSKISVEKVSVWNDQSGLPRPARALWLDNTSGLTLDGGSFSVLEDETFAGEGIVEPIRPGEKRLVSYAVDLAVNASSKLGTEQQRVTRVRLSKGVMTQEREEREKKTYTFRNEDTFARTVIIEHPVRRGYELRGESKPVETTAAWMRFRLAVEPKQSAALVVEEARPVQTTVALTNVDANQVALFVQQKAIDKTIEEALRRVLAQKQVISDLDAQKDQRESETTAIYDDQQRLRENIKALKGTPEEKPLLQRYTQQLNEQETRLATLQKETADLEKQQSNAQAALDKMIESLSFDVTL